MHKHSGRRPKILVNGPLPPPVGGMATYCADYLRTDLPRQFDIVFCRAVLLGRVHTTGGVLRFVLKVVNGISTLTVWLVMLLRRPHIAHVHTNSYTGFYVKGLMALFARAAGAKTILHIHGARFDEFHERCGCGARRIILWILRRNCRVVVLSKRWQEFFESIGVPRDRLVVLTNSVFLPELPEREAGPSRLTVLYMSAFEQRKGICELMDVIEGKRGVANKCRFVLAGPKGHQWDVIAARVQRLGLSDVVEMPGPLMGHDKEVAYRDADIYVLPSHAEGMPIGLLEAMSYGLACIATPVGGVPEVIRDRENGLLVPPGDVEALGGALEELIGNAELHARLGQQARLTIARDYNWVQRAEQIRELYLNMLQPAS